MKAVSLEKGSLKLIEKDVPRPSPGEALIRVRVAGICNTDIELLKGYYDFSGIPGHEFVGIVERAPGREELEGNRVVADINCSCGHCEMCRSGRTKHCLFRRTIGIKDWDGAFAEYLLAPVANLHLVPDSLSDEEVVFAEPLAAALEPSQQIHITSQQRILVMGDGKLGLLTALALRHYNPGITLLGQHEDKLAIAEAEGIKTIRYSAAGHQDAGTYDIVIEATGTPEGINEALHFVRAEGTIVAKTTSHRPSSINLSRVVVNEICILGSRCGDMTLALSFLQERNVNVLPLVEGVYGLDDFSLAFTRACRPDSKKVLIRMDQGSL